MIDKQQFLSLIESDKELFTSLLDLYKEDWPKVFRDLEVAVSEKNAKDIERLAHRLKGNLRNFYAESESDIAMNLETAGREGDLEGLSEKMIQLKTALESVEKQLEDFYKSIFKS